MKLCLGKWVFPILGMLYGNSLFAQYDGASKPALDTSDLGRFKTVDWSEPVIRKDGEYVFYSITNWRDGYYKIVLHSTKDTSSWVFNGACGGLFTADNDQIILKKNQRGDSLCVLNLKDGSAKSFGGIKKYILNVDQKWLIYSTQDSNKSMILLDILHGKNQEYADVRSFEYSPSGDILTYLSKGSLHWLNLKTMEDKVIWIGQKASHFAFNGTGDRLAFYAMEPSSDISICTYEKGMNEASVLLRQSDLRFGDDMIIDQGAALDFAGGGDFLQFNIKSGAPKPKETYPVHLNVWTYLDPSLQPKQLLDVDNVPSYAVIYNFKNGRTFRVGFENDERVFMPEKPNGDFAFVVHRMDTFGERNWNYATRPSFYLVSLKDGARKSLKEVPGNTAHMDPILSPSGKYLLYFDYRDHNYYSYNNYTGVTKNITPSVKVNWLDENYDMTGLPPICWGSIWREEVDKVIVRDNYDEWSLDLTGSEIPQCITHGFGKKNHIRLGFFDVYHAQYSPDRRVLLTGFNVLTKETGFYLLNPGKQQDPVMLSIGNYIYITGNEYVPAGKAKDSETYILKRMDARHAPNYFATRNFKDFYQISDVEPQEKFNWYTTRLVTWKRPDGKPLQGIVYLPEDFDSSKKYPVIFHMYELMSNNLNEFVAPTAQFFEISYMVSHGYIVVTPDIRYSRGKPGQSALDAVLSAARFLGKYKWIDTTKMAVEGHSWGGFEVSYIVSHTHFFAAACDGAGPTDFVSGYGLVSHGGQGTYWLYETGQARIGATLWENPQAYISNSPVFYANQVTTPLMIMQGRADDQVPWTQGLEWFNDLRRLQKKVWMLEYDGAGHAIFNYHQQLDFYYRTLQFFDFYLKGSAAPKWIVEGIPAKMKDIDSGLELEPLGVGPGPGLTAPKDR